MIRFLFFVALVLVSNLSSGQDFSNKGKDFWLCFPSHVPNERFGTIYYAKMSLFITSDKSSSGKVSIPGVFTTSFTVTAGQVTEIDVPYNSAHINQTEAGSVIKKGIRVQVDAGKPAVVVYSQIYAGFRSAASLILPTAVLGKKYYSMNAPQQSISGSKSQFVIVAVDTNTTVQITPLRDGIKGAPFAITLPLPGDLYEFQDDMDLTGSVIESISNGTEGCKRIAVFSGSSAININSLTPCIDGDSYDPLYQQLYPVTAWGKTYGLMPFENYANGSPYRIVASENNTAVMVNGVTVATLNEGQCYPDKNLFGLTETKGVLISGDKPISVAQYAQRSGCSGATPPSGQGYGDPDMVILNPVEQNVNNITVFSSQKENIYADSKFINVLIKAASTASFTINGVKPSVVWNSLLPFGSGYSFAKIKLPASQSSFTLSADSGFNAMAYGFGDFESYAYSAGTNVKDLYRQLIIENEFGEANIPLTCRDASFKISVTFPYQPTRINALFNGLFVDETIDNPVAAETFLLNGRTVYKYKLNQAYRADKTGIFPVTVVAENATVNSCSNGKDEIDFDLEIVERPKVDWTFINKGCVGQEVSFTDKSDAAGREIKKWFWQFDDGAESIETMPVHTYAYDKDYKVKHWAANDIGCGTDSLEKIISVTNIPMAKFSTASLLCEGSSIVLTNESTMTGTGTITQWNWNFGDGVQEEIMVNNDAKHSYTAAGPYTISLQSISGSGCKSEVFTKELIINAAPKASFKIPAFCLPAGSGKFINESAISDGTENSLSYAWDFGDGKSGTIKEPVHQYNDKGPYTVKLTTTSIEGCTDDSSAMINSIYLPMKLSATIGTENCLGENSLVTVITNASNTQLGALYWTEGAEASFVKDDIDANTTIFSKTLNFATAGDHTIKIFGEIGNTGCYTDTVIKNIYVNRLPQAGFKADNFLCDLKPVNFIDISKATDGKIIKWLWTTSDGKTSTQQNPSFIFSKGTHTINLVNETDKGCISKAQSQQLIVKDNPVPDFELPLVCSRDMNAQFINKSYIADGIQSDLKHTWNFNDANANSVNPNNSTTTDPVHSFISAGVYNIQLSVLSKDGCVADTTKTFIVNGSQPKANFTVREINNLCSNNDVEIKDISSIDFGKIIRLEIYWDYDNDPLQKTIDHSPSPGRTYTHKYPETQGADKLYKIKYIVYSGVSCLNEYEQIVSVKAVPQIEFYALPGVCENISSFLIPAKEEYGLTGTGAFTGKAISANGLFDPQQARPGIHQITYTFTSKDGCANSKTQVIEVYAKPLANAGGDKIIEKGAAIELEGYGKGNGIKYLWSPATNMSNASLPNPKVSPEEDVIYKLSVVSSEGCEATDEVQVKVLKDIFVPNAFTPNNDGKNDRWGIPYLEYYNECVVQIFNRYGQRVFYSEGYGKPWDGTFNAVAVPTGTYVWEIRLQKGRKPMSGFVTVIR